LLSQLERLPEHLERRDASGQRLNALLAELPGVKPLKRHEGVTRQSYYCYGFRFMPAEWDGVTRGRFCEALSAETGLGFSGVYEPLTHSSIYQPHTKKRHRISDEYWAKINPSAYSLPATENMATNEAVVTGHATLLLGPAAMDKIGEAIAKIHKNQSELKD
jgi:dTDP-4-amino-4,6-dideoxygalactose transaminase